MLYHVAVQGVQSGPFPEEVVRQKIATGEIGPGDLCWREGWAEWMPVAAAFPESGAPTPPPIPVAPPVFAKAPAVARAETSGLAITALVLGVMSVFASIFTGLPAIICGHLARAQIKKSEGALTGGGLALTGLIFGYIFTTLFVVIMASVMVPTYGRVHTTAQRSVDASNLRQIGQASLIYASDNGDKLPTAPDVWSYAGELARGGGLNDASVWFAGREAEIGRRMGTVLQSGDRTTVDPAFRAIGPSIVVPLGGITADMPSTTPIAWTRGLQRDGTWSKDSPHGGEGGHIVFLGGNVMFYRRLADAPLTRFDGSGTTTNILEALPPGTVVSRP